MSQDWFLCLGPSCLLRNLNTASTSAVDQTPCTAPRHAVKQAWKSTNIWPPFGIEGHPGGKRLFTWPRCTSSRSQQLDWKREFELLFPPSQGPRGSNPALRREQLQACSLNSLLCWFNIIIGHLRLFKALKVSQIELDGEKTWNITVVMQFYT